MYGDSLQHRNNIPAGGHARRERDTHGRYDARIYTDDKVKLARALGRYVSHLSALEHKAAAPSYGRSVAYESGDRGAGQTMEISR